MTERVPVVPGLFVETPEGPRLLGSRCGTCGTHFFPKVGRCTNPTCRSESVHDAELGPHATLYSYTVQHYAPPPPFRFDPPFQPFAVGLVELREGLRVISMLALPPSEVRIGMPLRLVIEPMATDDQGRAIVTWKFAPEGAAS